MHKSEKVWLTLSFGMILLFMIATGYQAFALEMAPPGGLQKVDPQKLEVTAPFDKPGLKQIGENEYEAVMILQAFGFTPQELEIPAGSTVHFKLTSKDVIHGFQIVDTNVNGMVMPGHVLNITQTFEQPGNYLVLCNEYCGAAHQYMSTTITVK
jgi:cytochrome c oxidase subunit II